MNKTFFAWSHLISYQKVSTQIVCRGQHELSFRQNLLTVSQNMLIGGFYTKKQIDQPIYQLFTKITKQLSKAQCCQKILCTSQRSWWKGSDGCKEKRSVRKNTNRKKNKKYWQKPIYAQNIEPPGTWAADSGSDGRQTPTHVWPRQPDLTGAAQKYDLLERRNTRHKLNKYFLAKWCCQRAMRKRE